MKANRLRLLTIAKSCLASSTCQVDSWLSYVIRSTNGPCAKGALASKPPRATPSWTCAGARKMLMHAHPLGVAPAETALPGLHLSQHCPLHRKLTAARCQRSRAHRHQQLFRIAADGSSNTAFAIEAPGDQHLLWHLHLLDVPLLRELMS